MRYVHPSEYQQPSQSHQYHPVHQEMFGAPDVAEAMMSRNVYDNSGGGQYQQKPEYQYKTFTPFFIFFLVCMGFMLLSLML